MKKIDEYGMVIDLELAKSILIEYFSMSESIFCSTNYLINKIKNCLVQIDECNYSFRDNEGYIYFGGPDGDSGFWIQELSKWIEENKDCYSINGFISDLNEERKVFYDLDGDIKCFIIHEMD